jgi:dethiobiotin synthetase
VTLVVVTGTNTGIGKTVVSAALAARLVQAGHRVAVVKPVQTGLRPEQPGDLADVSRLSGVTDTYEFVRLLDPLAPDTAARLRGIDIPPVAVLGARLAPLARSYDVTVVEGAGGVFVRLDTDGGTLIDLAGALREHGEDVRFLVVTLASLGTLNHTELTVGALRHRGFEPAGLVLGSFAHTTDLAERQNLTELPRVTGVPIVGALPIGVGDWQPDRFQAAVATWLPQLGWLQR